MDTIINTKNFTYGAYVRKSSESEDRQVQSIERQKDDLYTLVEKESLLLYDDIIEETKSAFSIGREGFNELVKLTEKGSVNAWLCWHANRLSRNAMDSGIIIHLMDTEKLHHIRTPSRIYHNTPVDKMMLQIEFAMSKKDSDDKSMFVKSGLNKRYQKGFTSSKAPIGFLNDKTQEQGNRGWLVDKERLDKVKLLFNRFLKGRDSLNSITEYAQNTLCLTTAKTKRKGGNLVGRSTVELILKNPVYAGFFYSKNAEGHHRQLRILNKDLPRVITEEEHIKVLNIFGNRHSPMKQRHTTPYSGYIVSADGHKLVADVKLQIICDCGKKFAYRSKKYCPACLVSIQKMKQPKYLSYTYYFNHHRKRTLKLKVKSVEQKQIDKLLIEFHKNELEITEPLLLWIKQHIAELKKKEIEDDKKVIRILKTEIQKIELKKERLRTLFIEQAISLTEYKRDIEKLNVDIERKKNKSKLSENWHEQINQLLDAIYNFEDIIKNANCSDKKKLLKLFCSNLVWDEEKLYISKADWLKTFIDGRKTVLRKYPMFEPKNNGNFKGLNGILDINCPVLWEWLDNIRKKLCNK
jgi:DNA invertase Pin-like site-specific DNA recombinase